MSSDQREAAAKTAAIDRQIAQAAEEKAKTVKLLLLGLSLFHTMSDYLNESFL